MAADATWTSSGDVAFEKPKDENPVSSIPLHRQQFRSHDLRFKLGTSKQVAEDSKLYAEVCPDKKSPIRIDETTGRPISNETKAKKNVSFVRQTEKRVHYINKSYSDVNDREITDPVLVGVFAYGTHFSGDELTDVQPFIDLSLEVDVTPLANWVNKLDVSQEDIIKWILNVNQEVLRISDEIKRVW